MKGNMQEEKIAKTNRLVLCFDGTGNEYTGKSGDTNIVKLYRMFDRSSNQQYHYYQRMFSITSTQHAHDWLTPYSIL
jgi:uncharacterized protein (DUF2235 family)